MISDSINYISRRRLVLAAAASAAPALARSSGRAAEVDALLAAICGPLARVHDIPGLVVGLLFEGRKHFLTLGSTTLQGGSTVTADTLFELGSISKCFTSLLAGLVHVQGRMGLEQPVGEVVHALRDTPIGQATPLHLATYTAGGLPLQFPDGVNTSDQAIAWLGSFVPNAAPGTVRRYSNPSIGLLGHAAAVVVGKEFTGLSEHMLASLGLGSTFITVPRSQMHRYAWGHDKTQRQVRVNPGAFDAQAYGVKSSGSDLLQFMQAVLDPDRMPPTLRQALAVATTPRYQIGPMQQGMGWEMYLPPWSVADLQQGNGPVTVLQPQPAKALLRSTTPIASLLLNKTGSTSGFGAYVALVPRHQVALVILANRNFPVADRVQAAHQILQALGV
jgi:beta-lactamase class C